MNTADDWLDQARRLVAGLGQTLAAGAAAPTGARAAAGGAEASAAAEPSAAAEGDCRWCPLCQAAAMLRGERPELTAALADTLTAAATALRAMTEPPRTPPAAREQPDTDAGGPAVQRIEIA